MKEKISALLKNKSFSRILFIVGIVGILLIFLSTFLGEGEKKPEKTAEEEFSTLLYVEELKTDIKRTVEAICGDSDAVVTLTLESGPVYKYAEEIKQNNKEEGGATSKESEHKYITVEDSSGGEVPLVVTSYMPGVRGVSIICSYGSEETAEKIKSAVTAALDISSRKIHIGSKGG